MKSIADSLSGIARGSARLARRLAARVRMGGAVAASGLLLAVAVLPGCTSHGVMPFNATELGDADYGTRWSMPDTEGRMRSLEDFRGKIVYVFFGFTFCPDVCPTTMTELAQVKSFLGKDADDFQVVFVTIDPERDTPEQLRTYVRAFDPTAVALVGDSEQLAVMAREFKAFYRKEAGPAPSAYMMSHTAGGYVFDRWGKLRLYAEYGTPAHALFSDVQRLMLEPEAREIAKATREAAARGMLVAEQAAPDRVVAGGAAK